MIRTIKIEAYQVGLVFENRKLIKVAEEGLHWIFGNKKVMIYDMNTAFQAPFELNILLEMKYWLLCWRLFPLPIMKLSCNLKTEILNVF